MPDIYQFIQ